MTDDSTQRPPAPGPVLEWESVVIWDGSQWQGCDLERARVPGGWLVCINQVVGYTGGIGGLTFVPDPDGEWK